MSTRATALRREAVPSAFDAGAPAYDRLTGANPGYHAHLRLSARRMRLPSGGRGLRLLDAGCGTGASTAALLAAAPHAQIVAVDASSQMLARARAKAWPSCVRFVHTRVEDLAGAGGRLRHRDHPPQQDRSGGAGGRGRPPRGRHVETCPVRAFEAWQAVARRKAGPLFRKISTGDGIGDTALHPDAMRQILARFVPRTTDDTDARLKMRRPARGERFLLSAGPKVMSDFFGFRRKISTYGQRITRAARDRHG